MLRHRFDQLMLVRTADEELRRRGRQIIIIGLGLLASALIGQVATLIFQGIDQPLVPALVVIELIHVGAIVLAQRAYVTAAALLQVSFSLITTLLTYALSNGAVVTAAFLVLTIVLANLTLRSAYVWPVVIICSLSMLATISYVPLAQPDAVAGIATLIILYGLVGLLAFLGARSYERAYQLLMASRREAEQSAQQLTAANSGLEQRVAERTAALEGALADVSARTADLQVALSENAQQRAVIRALGVPVLPLARGTLVLPLVGELDSVRLQQVQEQALLAIERLHARQVILDITGVPLVDSQVAQGLMLVVSAAQLLGAQTMLVGIRPEVAQSIVGLGLDLSALRTFADLQSALETVAS